MPDEESQQSLPRPPLEDTWSRMHKRFPADLTIQLDYLIIAKVVANRLCEVLDGLISPFQSAFIPGRQMIDNIMLAEEMVVAWRRSGTA